MFNDGDQPEAPRVGIVNSTMARRKWPNEDPVGRRLRFANSNVWITVVGIAGDVRSESLDKEPSEKLYLPFSQQPNGTELVVRTNADPKAAIRDLRGIVYQINPEQAIASIRTMNDVVDESLAAPKLTAKLIGMLAALTLIITIAGIGGVAAVATDQRRTEIGVRLALGAIPSRLVGLIVRQEMIMVIIGLVIGVASAVYVGRLITRLLFGTPPTDLITYISAAGLMLSAAMFACLLPAVRAVRLDPVKTLRSE
jgi:putative ABC transport system permease protein